ncbi:MAG: phospholipase [Pirellulaceae bacterium]|jgi:hypothetical protein|nr:phospholipase [Pirellulaceae bacterium]MDP7019442.1 phospholipase [Pirellulaceae bacterium]
MTITASALRELHRIHRQLSDVRGRLDKGPRQLRAAELSVDKAQTELAEAKELLTRARVASDDKQLQLKQREDRILELKAKLNTAASNREYQALKEQMAADEQANSVLSDEILESLERIDELQIALDNHTKSSQNRQAELSRVRQSVESESSVLQGELTRVEAELAAAEKLLPADFKADYDRIAKVRGDEALAAVEGDVCGGCFFTLTIQMRNEMLKGNAVFCVSCGALLYLPEDTTFDGSD